MEYRILTEGIPTIDKLSKDAKQILVDDLLEQILNHYNKGGN